MGLAVGTEPSDLSAVGSLSASSDSTDPDLVKNAENSLVRNTLLFWLPWIKVMRAGKAVFRER